MPSPTQTQSLPQAAHELQSVKPHVGLDEKGCMEVCQLLNGLLANHAVLWAKTCNYSHNVLGPRSCMLAQLFKGQSTRLLCHFDKTATQLRALGHRVPHLPELLQLAELNPLPDTGATGGGGGGGGGAGMGGAGGKEGRQMWPDAQAMLRILLNDNERMIQRLCEHNHKMQQMDGATVDFIYGIIREHRELAMELRNHLEPQM